ncbi:hypothetical protein KUH03_06310 [Sphingobacterium sp. E70]|nr:hypothetical protein [Sphingobacterium sp. E70]ULT26483.1 hypothetical protein KUH03_06310 [Sphingobacterium sp. E70]
MGSRNRGSGKQGTATVTARGAEGYFQTGAPRDLLTPSSPFLRPPPIVYLSFPYPFPIVWIGER